MNQTGGSMVVRKKVYDEEIRALLNERRHPILCALRSHGASGGWKGADLSDEERNALTAGQQAFR